MGIGEAIPSAVAGLVGIARSLQLDFAFPRAMKIERVRQRSIRLAASSIRDL
jgi:hypothetical protein